jgi:hypothetical protein
VASISLKQNLKGNSKNVESASTFDAISSNMDWHSMSKSHTNRKGLKGENEMETNIGIFHTVV